MPYANYQAWKTTPIEGKPYLSVIIPTYNEEERILPTIGAVASHVSDLRFPWELIVSDDGSTDQTVWLVEDLSFANLRLLRGPHEGKGSAVRRGMLSARGRYALFTDSDNSTPIEEVGKFLHKLEHERYDLAVGSRAALGAEELNRTATRQHMSAALRWTVRAALHISISDTQCGFKMFTQEAARRLFGAQTMKGFSFDLEILHLASRWGARIAEIPVAWIDAPGSKVDSLKDSLCFLRDLAKIELNDLTGVYDAVLSRRPVPQGEVP